MKRILSAFLALTMVLTMLPIPAHAEETQPTEVIGETLPETTDPTQETVPPAEAPTVPETTVPEQEETIPETTDETVSDITTEPVPTATEETVPETTAETAPAETEALMTAALTIIASGTCGSGLTWTLDDAGTLTISGKGTMNNYTRDSQPWRSYRDRITTIVIESGVTSIGTEAFYELGQVKTAVIPDTVTAIADGAFCWCEGLTSIDIPGSVTYIGEAAFWCCLDLATVTFHEGLKTIDQEAFQGCRLITSLDFPESLESIGYWAFGGCSDLLTVNIPAGVKMLDDSVFSACTNLKTVTLHEGLTSIGGSTFAYCFALENITIPGSVQSIGDTAFYLCSVLGSVKFTGGPPSISETAFASAVATVSYPDVNADAWSGHTLQYNGTLTWQSYSVSDHVCTTSVVEPTCLVWGYTRHACTDCGEVYMDSYQDPLGHSWDSGKTSGSRTTYTCTRCKTTRYEYNVSGSCGTNARWTLDTEEGILHITGTGPISVSSAYSLPWKNYISNIRHVVIDMAVEATCTETGLTDGKHCSVCGEVLTAQTVVPAKGHAFGDWMVTVEPSYGQTGEERRDCKHCNHYEVNILPVLGAITDTGRTLSLSGALLVNFYVKLDKSIGTPTTAEMLFWDGVKGELTLSNVSYKKDLIAANGEYAAQSDMIPARAYGETIYACAHFVDAEGNDHYSDVMPYSAEEYAAGRIAKSSNASLVAAMKAMVLYGEAARNYFA